IVSISFTQRINVDLPEPDGPQITIFSPFSTVSEQSVRAWKSPYHLWTPSICKMGEFIAYPVSSVVPGSAHSPQWTTPESDRWPIRRCTLRRNTGAIPGWSAPFSDYPSGHRYSRWQPGTCPSVHQ